MSRRPRRLSSGARKARIRERRFRRCAGSVQRLNQPSRHGGARQTLFRSQFAASLIPSARPCGIASPVRNPPKPPRKLPIPAEPVVAAEPADAFELAAPGGPVEAVEPADPVEAAEPAETPGPLPVEPSPPSPWLETPPLGPPPVPDPAALPVPAPGPPPGPAPPPSPSARARPPPSATASAATPISRTRKKQSGLSISNAHGARRRTSNLKAI